MKIILGMFRPDWWEFYANIRANVLCSCGLTLSCQSHVRDHWQQGHFDTPVYKEIKEPTGKRIGHTTLDAIGTQGCKATTEVTKKND